MSTRLQRYRRALGAGFPETQDSKLELGAPMEEHTDFPSSALTSGEVQRPLLRLLRQGGMYTLSNLAVKVAGLLLLGFFLNPAFLAQADYGRFQLLEVMAQLLILVGGMGMAAGLLKFLHDDAYADEKEALPFTALAGAAVCGLVLAALTSIFARPLASFLVDDPEAVTPVRLTGLYVALKLVAAVPFMMLRAHERAGLFALAATSEAVLLVAAVAFQLVVLDAGLNGIMTGYVISAAGSALLLTSLLVKKNKVRIRLSLLRPLAKFGAPLALAGLASVTLNAGDRFILKALTDAELVAVYGLAAKYGGLVNMLFVQSFNMAFAVIGLKALSSGVGSSGVGSSNTGGMHVHRRTFRHYVVLTGWGVLGVSLLARDVTEVLSSNPAFLRAEPLVLPIALGFMAYGIYFIGMNILYADGRTPAIAIGVALAATLNIALNLFAIPRWGAMGAALATLVAYVALAAWTLARAHRVAPVKYRWEALAAVVCILLGLWALGQVSGVWGTALRLPFRLALIGCYPLLILVAGLYSREELRELFRRMVQFFGRSAEPSVHGSTPR